VQCFLRDEWRCRECGWEPEIVSQFRLAGLGLPDPDVVLDELRRAFLCGNRHLHADHVVPIESDASQRLDLGNLQTLCDLCHRRKTQAEGALAAR
jgi:5-methylcytosine-specific restriction endonuclease McrA